MSVTYFENRTIVDKDGNVIDSEREVHYKSEEPNYVKFYIDAWCAFKDIKGVNTRFLYQLLPFMSYAADQQLICITAYIKRQISHILGWSEKSALNRFSQEIARLCQKKVLRRIDTNTYQVNPELIGKGPWKDIQRLRPMFNLETGEVVHFYEQELGNIDNTDNDVPF